MRSTMKITSLFLFFCVIAQAQTPQQQYNKLMREMLSLAIDETKTVEVNNLQIKRDVGTFSFRSGTLYALSSINGNVHGALFVGKGTFTCLPPTEIEKKQLYRFYGKDSLVEEFESVFLLFNDSTFTELSKTITFVPSTVPLKVNSLIHTSLKYIENDKQTSLDYDILRQYLFNEPNDFFFSHIITHGNQSYFFVVDPFEIEAVSLQRKTEGSPYILANYQRETICQFHSQMNYVDSINLSHESKSMVKMSSYKMDNTIRNNLVFSSKCVVTFTNLKNKRKWIPFLLYNKLMLDSVVSGKENYFGEKDEKSDVVWIGSEQPFPIDKEISITLYYHGDLIEEDNGWYSLQSSIEWYPWPMDERQYTTFDLTFHTPKNLTFAAIGKMFSYDTTDNDITSHWVLNNPVRNASFILGNYTEYTTTPDNGITVTLYLANAHDAHLKSYLASQMVLSGRNMDKQITADIQNSVQLFQQLFGKINSDHLYVAEIPDRHGESFPGLMHLSWTTFQNTQEDGSDEVFRAHEVAHQWWASGVDFRTYHDQWLSEAFAEYSGLWYMQLVLHNNEKFFEMLEEYKTSILSNRKYLFSSGQEAGPIWLGYRTQSSSTKGDYDLIIYRKGAWVLHMLRNLSIDLKTMNEDVFKETMKDFYTKYVGSQASTEEFKQVVEKHFGMDMSWFFNQWIYGTEIPVYSIQYRCNKLTTGKYSVHCTVKQKNVSNDFQMSVPFYIDFGENQHARIRYLIKGPITEFDFPLLPLKPEKIKFNDLESVLCEIEDEDWE